MKWIRFGVVLWLACPSAFALDPTLPPSQYVRERWSPENGLPDSTVFAVAETADGYFWFGAETGLVRFDGVRFRRFSTVTDPAFATSLVNCLVAAKDDTLWIGTRSGLIEYRDGDFRRVERPKSDDDALIRDLFEDDQGRVWVASDGELGMMVQGKYEPFESAPGKRLRGPHAVRQSTDRSMWFLSSDGLYRWKDGVLDFRALAQVSQTMTTDGSGRVWVFPTGRLIGYSQETLEPVVDEPLPGLVTAALATADDTLWLALESQFLRRRDGILEAVMDASDLATTTIRFHRDRSGALWAGTIGNGVWRLSDPVVRSFGRPEGLAVDYVNSVLEASDGAIWVGSLGLGVHRWDGRHDRGFGVDQGLPSESVFALLETRRGAIWVGTSAGLAIWNGSDRFRAVELPGSGRCLVAAIAELADGSLLAGTACGYYLLRDGRWRKVESPPELAITSAIEPLDSGEAWAATLSNGLLRWDGTRVVSVGTAEEIGSRDPVGFWLESPSRLWIGTADRGLILHDGKSFRRIGPAEGLPEGPIYRILSAAGSLWLSGKDGITRLRLAELDELLAGRRATVSIVRIGRREGMRAPECNGGAQPAGWKAKNGRLWFPTVSGIVELDPNAAAATPRAKPVVLEELTVDGEGVRPAAGGLELAAGVRRVEIRFTSPGLTSPDRYRFQYRLEGFDPTWVDAGTGRVASYTNLPPGQYGFVARARIDDGDWNELAAPLRVSKAPHYWQTWWFALALVVALATLALLVVRLRIAAIRRRFAAVAEERNRISREIHDSLTQSFAGVVVNLEAAERATTAKPETSVDRIGRAKTIARQGLAESRRFIRGLRPLALESASLDQAIAAMIQDAGAGASAEIAFQRRGRLRPLPPAAEDQLFRIAQEAVTNALRHSGATRIQVELGMRQSTVEMTITDDGRGFDPDAVKPTDEGGYGLRGMRERIAALGGDLKIVTSAGAGTRIEIRVPVP